jgi:hypothetical protein
MEKNKGGRPTETGDTMSPVGTSRLYIEERLKRDHPKVWKDYYALLRTCTCGKLLFKGISSVGFADVFNYAHAKV